ncbi:tyrosine-type recombinase/integrase [Cohnella sp.]|uniref:tyrosine-type recombinase/integrase n=1 Tax=Cohnella sp. TaxID=1883426 RepID=UPI00356987A9
MLSERVKSLKLPELIAELEKTLLSLNYRYGSMARFKSVWDPMLKYAEKKGVSYFSMEFARQFVQERFGFSIGEKDHTGAVTRAVHVIADFQQYGMVFKQTKVNEHKWPPQFEKIFEGFLDYLRDFGFTSGSCRTWRSRFFRFADFLDRQGVQVFSEINKSHINRYLETLSSFSSGTVYSTICNLKKLFQFAVSNGYHPEDLSSVLPVVRRVSNQRIPSAYTSEEVAKLLAAVDRANPIGKRDYAILMLVARLGLRISDVRELTFDEIKWEAKRIELVQKKTDVVLVLPLLEDIGWAIIDYLKNGRPETDCNKVFIRHQAPFDGLGTSMQYLVVKYMRAAGITPPTGKKTGMHALRHSLATALLEKNTPMPVISEILGHVDSHSTEFYLKIDIERLRKCSLEVE